MVAAAKPAAIAGPTIISSGDHGEPALSIRAKEEIEQGQGASRGVRFTPRSGQSCCALADWESVPRTDIAGIIRSGDAEMLAIRDGLHG